MLVKFWGSRGSIPVSGIDHVKYGGDTTCIEIRNSCGDIIIVDAGTGIRRLGNSLAAANSQKCHFLLTHAHWDHLAGFPFFSPLYSADNELIVHSFSSQNDEKLFSSLMTPPFFPIKYEDIKARIKYSTSKGSLKIGSTEIIPVALSHPGGGTGYKFIDKKKTFIFMTDNELGHVHPGGYSINEYSDFCKGADVLVHDAEYTSDEYRKTITWGHSSYGDALDLALKAGVERLGFFHLNQERTDRQADAIVEECKRKIEATGSCLDCFAAEMDMTIEI